MRHKVRQITYYKFFTSYSNQIVYIYARSTLGVHSMA